MITDRRASCVASSMPNRVLTVSIIFYPFDKRIASRIAVAAKLCDSIRCYCDPLRWKDVSGLVFPEIVLRVEESLNHSIH
jgi:hypothetical protein